MSADCKYCSFHTELSKFLNDDCFEQLSANHAVVSFVKGDSIIKQGALSTNVVFLRKGLAKIHLAGPSREQIVRLVKAPTYLGLPTTLGDKINQYSVSAVSDVEVCFIDINVFQNLLQNNHTFAYQIILELCRNDIESYHRCANRTQKQTRGNLAEVLLEFSNCIFESDSFTFPVSQTELGSLIDTSRESISRFLGEFDKDGIISLKGKQITILDKKILQLISNNG
jgi:CRP/FNR family transcriptional regulator